MTRAPKARISAVLEGLFPTGTTIVHGTPARVAAKAIDWPWFPVVAEMTPRVRSASSSRATRCSPPRTLNAPVGL